MNHLRSRSKAAMTAVLAASLLAIPSAALAFTPEESGSNDGSTPAEQGVTEEDDDDGTPDNQPDDGDNAHPSGNDRSVDPDQDHGSPADPDDDGRGPDRSNGGTDKPGGDGGVDEEDQDYDNGCGNDDDFEDDNEGLCGGSPENQSASAGDEDQTGNDAAPAGDDDMTDDLGEDGTQVAADNASTPANDVTAGTPGGTAPGSDDTGIAVLGAQASQDVEPAAATGTRSTLPFTGAPVAILAAAGVAALGAGAGVLRRLNRR